MKYDYDLRKALEYINCFDEDELEAIEKMPKENQEDAREWIDLELDFADGNWEEIDIYDVSTNLETWYKRYWDAYYEKLEDEYFDNYSEHLVSKDKVTVDGKEYPVCALNAEDGEYTFYDEKSGEMVTKVYSDFVGSHIKYMLSYYKKAKCLQSLVDENALDKYLERFSERTEGLDDKIRSLADKMAEKDADIQKCKENGKLDEAKGLYNNILHSAREIIYNEYIYC